MKRVFIYVRASTEEQAIHGLSIEAQTATLTNWAKENKCIIAGISARKPARNRPELQRLLHDVQAGKGELIIFTKLDRWFRNISEYYKVQEILEKYKVDWMTIQDADIIVVMDQGEIVESGNHVELLEKHGKYYNWYMPQYARFAT